MKHGSLLIITTRGQQWAAKVRTVERLEKGVHRSVLVADAGAWSETIDELKAQGADIKITHSPN